MIMLIRPIKGKFIITNGFYGKTKWYKIHKAIDIRTRCPEYPSGIGAPIYAVCSGIHIASGYGYYGGYYYRLAHPSGIEFTYRHLNQINWQPGWTKRNIGDIIGWSGNTGKWSTGPHLHLEVRKNGVLVDPEPYFYNYIISK